MATRPAIVDDPLDRRARLSTLGVTQETLLRAVASGEAARVSCLPTHPPGAPGMYCFFETFRSLADDLLDSGWSRKDHKNFSTVLRPDGLVAIAVARGDDGTGDRDANVSTMYSKGIMTREAIDRNLLLPLDARYVADNARETTSVATYFLLHSRKDGQLHAELSLPRFISRSGFVEEWNQRILLTPQQLDPTPVRLDVDPVEPIVTVKKRAG